MIRQVPRKTLIVPILLLLSLMFASVLQTHAQSLPELMYFTFDATGDQTNFASSPVGTNPATLTGLTVGGTGEFGTALVGNGGAAAGSGLNTGWATNLPASGWTIALWFNNLPAGSPTQQYLFGDTTASEFRCFVNGVASNGIQLLGGGLNAVLIPNVLPGPSVVHFVYNGTDVKAYLNGTLIVTVLQSSISITGTGPFKIGAYGDYNFLPTGGLIDEFRLYNRALSAAEVAATWNTFLLTHPVLNTQAATSVTSTGAVLNGTVNAIGYVTTVSFEYGPTTSYGSSVTAVPSQVTGWVTTPVTGTLTGLTPNTLYHYRLKAEYGSSTTTGSDRTFDLVPSPSITGPATVCAGSGNSTYRTQPGKSNYTWTVSAGGTIMAGGTTTSDTVTVAWTAASPQTVSVNYQNSAGVPAPSPATYPVTVNPLPTPTITGSGSVCTGSSGETYTTESGMTGYTWTVSAGGTVTGGGGSNNNTVTVTWNTAGAQMITVNYTNANGCSAITPAVINVTVNPLPVPTITGSAVECADTPDVIYTTEAGMTSYTWAISSGGTITAGAGTSSVTVTWNTAGSQTLSVSYIDTHGCSPVSSTVKNVTVNPLPVPTISAAPLMSESFENGGTIPTGWVTEEIALNNAITFPSTTTHPSGYSPYSGSYMVRFNSYDAGNGEIRLKRTVPVSTVGSLNVNVSFAWLESSSFSASNDRVEVEWSLDGTTWNTVGSFPRYNTTQGWKIKTVQLPMAAGQQPAIYIAFRFISEFGNDCYLDLAKVFLSNAAVCTGSSASYQTESGMTAYGWTISSGGTISSGSGTASIVVHWTTPGTKTVGVNYTNLNGCKASTPATTTTVVNPLPVPVISGPSVACRYDTLWYRTQKNMSSYLWTISSGGTVIGQSTDSLLHVAWDSVSSGGNRWVAVTYTNSSGCTGSTPSPFPVTVNPLPQPTITGPPSVCGNSIVTYQTETGKTGYSWTVSTGGVILAGSGTSSVTVRWDSVGARSVSVNYNNSYGCDALVPTSLPVTVHPLPVPSLSGPDSTCLNIPGQTYTTEAGMTGYVWTVSTGGTITAGGTTSSNFVTVTWTSTGTRTVSVSYTNSSGCTAELPTLLPVLVSPIPAPQLYGPSSACVQSTGNLYSTQQGMNAYTWTVSPGGNITSTMDSSAVSITWNAAGSQFVTVNYTSPAGCTGIAPDTLDVTVYSRPVPTISGPNSVCEATGGHSYTTEPMNTAYQWTLSGGGTIMSGSGTNVITVNWDSAGTRQVMVNYINPATGCNALTPTSYNVTVKPRPYPTISGPTPVCKGISGNHYTTESGMVNYIWDVSSGNTTTGGGTSGSNFIDITWNVIDTQTVSVNYTAPNGCTAPAATVYPVMVNPLPVPTIEGPDTVCVNTSGNLYWTEPGMFNYTWGISAGGTITAGAGTDTITVSWNLSGARSVSVNYNDSNGCSAAAPIVFNVQVLSLPVPTITGPASTCQGSTGNTYTTQAGMTDYQWVVSNGGTVTAGGSDSVNYVTVTWDSTGSQSVSAGYTNASGCTSDPLTVYNVTVHSLPVPTLSGETNPCQNGGNYAYSTESGMTGYQWTLSAGGQIVSGSGTSQVQINWLGAGSQWVAVNYTNGNGCTAPSATTLSVTVSTAPGQMGPVSGTDTICGEAVDISYSADPIANATSYNWTVPPGAIITSGAGTTSILVDYPASATSGNVAVTASNACGNGAPSPPLPVTVTPVPDAPVIHQEGDLLVSNVSTGNQWFLNSVMIPGANGQSFLAEEEGEYWDKVIVNGCASDTSNHIYVIITGIETSSGSFVSLFPNPNDGTFTLRFNQVSDETYIVTVMNQLGVHLTEKQLIARQGVSEHFIDLRPLPEGMYTILISGERHQEIRKIIVE